MSGTKGQKAKKLLGLEFAPVDIPAPRRLQIIAVLLWFFIFFVISIISYPIVIYLLLFSSFEVFKRSAAFLLPYLWWIWVVDRSSCKTGGRTITWVRNWTIWKWYSDYFPINIVKTGELNPNKNYLFGLHPQKTLSSGAFGCFATSARKVEQLFPGFSFHVLTLRLNFRWPLIRDLILSLGMCAATKEAMHHILRTRGGGKAAVVITGGDTDPQDSHRGSYVVKLKGKTDFIKVALQNGTALVPCFSFGEAEIHVQPKNSNMSPTFMMVLDAFKFIMPKRRPITVVIGTPIHVEIMERPSREEVDELHRTYVDALVELFYNHRGKYAADPKHILTVV